jgi:hypothetical protein
MYVKVFIKIIVLFFWICYKNSRKKVNKNVYDKGQFYTRFILNYKTFDFFDTKFDHSSYSIFFLQNITFFYRGLLY